MLQGLTHSPASSASASCPSFMISTSFYLGLQQGQVLLLPSIPSEKGQRPCGISGWSKALANFFPGRQYRGMFSKQCCGASHPPPTRYSTCSITEIAILWSCSSVMGQGSSHRGIGFPDHCQYPYFLFFTGSHKLCSQV